MDNLCHTLAGWALARTGLGRPRELPESLPRSGSPHPGRRAPAWAESLVLVLAANVPDADLVLGLLGTEVYLLWHRGLTHSVLGLAVFPPALAYLTHALAPAFSFRRALLLWEVGFVSHVLLDLPTSWGTLALHPWRNHRFALDWIFIVDPVLWALLLAGILLGVRRAQGARRHAAAAGLTAAGLYVLLAGGLHGLAASTARRALNLVPAAGTGDLHVFPLPFSPLRWHAVAWSGERLVHVPLDGIPPRAGTPRAEPHNLGDATVREALFTAPGQAFLWWAQAPSATVDRDSSGHARVRLGDRRYAGRGVDLFAMEITLDGRGRFVRASWEGEPVFEQESPSRWP
ncbi:MAG: metal-dependent hydrolase [Gemmatimonadota bacterium]